MWARGALVLAAVVASLTVASSAHAAGGTAMGWGGNQFGQIGNGTPSTNACKCVDAPVPVRGLSGVTQIAVGSDQSLALLADGTVMAWGDNHRGELGNGTTEESLTPTLVSRLNDVVAIATGEHHTLALLSNGTVMAWGDNLYGELGHDPASGPEDCGISPCSKVPVAVPGLSGVIALASGSFFSLALLSDGTVMAWGYNGVGALGRDPASGPEDCNFSSCSKVPVMVPGVSGATAIAAGHGYGSALLSDGTVKDWGANFQGELGSGTTTDTACSCLGPTAAQGLIGAKAIAAGGFHALALLSGGSLQAWGANFDGQLGNGSFTTTGNCVCIPTPAPVSGLAGLQAIAAGENHSLALLANGTVQAWGSNGHGQLGGPTSEEHRNLPAIVEGLGGGASGVFAGEADSFALIGPSQALKVSLVGAGAGKVGGAGILCPTSNCEGRYPQSQVEILRAEPTQGGFAGFSGPCTGIDPCRVKMDSDQAVSATFGVPMGTKITRAKINRKRKSAFFSFTAPGAITGFQCKLTRPRSTRKRHKRRKPRFSPCPAHKVYKHLRPGRYLLQVRALDILGADEHPARRRFALKAVPRSRR